MADFVWAPFEYDVNADWLSLLINNRFVYHLLFLSGAAPFGNTVGKVLRSACVVSYIVSLATLNFSYGALCRKLLFINVRKIKIYSITSTCFLG